MESSTPPASPDGKSWNTLTAGFIPAQLAGSPFSDTVLATTREGIQRSIDGGANWALESASPVIQFAAFADADHAVGGEPTGALHYSSDGGATWTRRGQINGGAQAIAAAKSPDGALLIWAATSPGLVLSTDDGMTFGSPEDK